MITQTTIDNFLPIGSLDAYIQRVNQIPMLSAEEESTLAQKFHKNNDLAAARQLVLAHLRFVVKVARGYLGYGLSHADLIQEGNVGLMKAIKRFDPEYGVRLVTFAIYWIKAEIHEFILRNWRIVKIATTKAQRKLFFNLRKMKKRLGWFTHQEVQDVAKELGVKPSAVLQMEARLASCDSAFDSPPKNSPEADFSPVHYIEDLSTNPEQLLENSDWLENSKTNLSHALTHLDSRSQTILQKRWLAEKKATLQELANDFNVSAERIRQLEQLALNKLKSLLIKKT